MIDHHAALQNGKNMSQTVESDYEKYVRRRKYIAQTNVVIMFSVVAVCALIMKYATFLVNLIPESHKRAEPVIEITYVFGIAIILAQTGFYYSKKLWRKGDLDNSKLGTFTSILLLVSIVIYSGIIAVDISFPIMSKVNDIILILMRIGLFIAIFIGIVALFMFGGWLASNAVIDHELIPLEKRVEKQKENAETAKHEYRMEKPAASISVPNQPIEFVGEWSKGHCDDQVIDVLFTATGYSPPKIEDYDWSIESAPYMATRLRVNDGEIKILLCPPYYFLEPPFEKPSWWWHAEHSYHYDGDEWSGYTPGLTILTLTGMHRDYGGPGIMTKIAVVDYDAPDWLKENIHRWML